MRDLHSRFFFLSLDLMAVANPEGYFIELNPAWTRTLGFSLEELRQMPFIDFVHPEDREATLKEAAKLFAGADSVYFENRYRSKDGSYRWLAWTSRLSDEDKLIFACARDITAQKELLADRDRFRALAENTTDFVGMVDLTGSATYLNPAGKRLLGDPDMDTAQIRIAGSHPPEYTERVLNEGLPYAAAHGTWTADGVILNKDGRTIPVSQVVVALKDEKGALAGFGTIIRDLSMIEQFKKLEQELRNQQSSLLEMLHAMSTPIIPITEHIVVMPLIGTMDSHRAEQFLDAALEGAAARGSQVIIIDITGLRHIDSGVAETLVRTAAALKLLGAVVVLTGIRAEIARTLVGLGLELSTLTTHSTLQSGITHALGLIGESLGKARARR
jgi:rsbT co-antagonist protein RsbR